MNKGFTLIELSIVLIIISLVVAGVTGGQALIRQAELQSITTDVQTFKTALNTFILQYDDLPGDMVDPVAYWPAAITAVDARKGNGIIEDVNGGYDEHLWAWNHLALSEILPGEFTGSLIGGNAVPGENVPKSKLDGTGFDFRCCGPTFGRRGPVIVFGEEGAGIINNWALTVQGAKSVDNKMDDGEPDSGTVHGVANPNCVDGDFAALPAVDANYQLDTNGIVCQLHFYYTDG